MKLRTVLEAVGAALLLLPYFFVPLVPDNLALYHHGLPVTHLIAGYLIDLLGVFALVLGFLIAVELLPPLPRRLLLALFTGVILWRSVDFVTQILGTIQQPILFWDSVRLPTGIAICLLAGALACVAPGVLKPVEQAVRFIAAAFALSAIWIVPGLIHIALAHPSQPDTPAVQLSAQNNSGSNRRIVWILFDELSFDQTFDHPAPGVQLPNLDRLREQSVSFSRLTPVGYLTDHIIPSLFLGRRIDRVRSTVDGDLQYTDEAGNRWIAFDSNATLFAVARRNGWSTGIDGWYNPYCHILAQVLDSCSWEPVAAAAPFLQTEVYGASESKSALANAAVLPNAVLEKLAGTANPQANGHLQEYNHIMERTQALIGNQQIRFVFLHLNVPHPPGIFNRRKHLIRAGGTYLDNLVLADDTLGTLLQEIDATPSAVRTTVIVSSDHSWRVPMWRPTTGWSAEEERASGGRFDDRPVLLIHFPGQTSGVDVNSPLPELIEHDIIAGMLQGQISSPNDLAAFLAHASVPDTNDSKLSH